MDEVEIQYPVEEYGMVFHEDHILAEGTRWGLTCAWDKYCVGADLPDCLIVTPEEAERRRVSWVPPVKAARTDNAIVMPEKKRRRRSTKK